MHHHNLLYRLIRYALGAFTFHIDGEDGGGPVEPAPAAESAAPAAEPAAAPAATEAPTSMLDAITQGLNQPRDELGRFANKPADAPADPAAQPATPAAPAAQAGAQLPAQPAAKPDKPAVPKPDELTMPEGLQPKAQERFQALANTVREQRQELQQAQEAISYVQTAFKENGVQREQFEQATAFIGAINRGDLATAEQVLLGQLQQLSLLTGKNYGAAVDPLQGHQDLRQAVDGLQITEQHAIELARARAVQQAQHQRQQQTEQQQQETQRHQAAVQQGTMAVDRLCKQLAATDMDYAAIEAQLLPVIPQLLQGMPPNQWENAVRVQYDLLKSAAATFRQQQAGSGQSAPLRATGSPSVHQPPRNLYEAMWGQR